MPDGRVVQRITLQSQGMTAQVLTLGGIVQDLRMDGVAAPLVLGSPDVAAYLGRARYWGAIVGRFANRIGGGRFALNGRDYQTDQNFLDRHTLHGGSDGLDQQIWTVEDLAADRVTLSVSLPDGHMGFPGNLHVMAEIALHASTLAFDFTAETDAPTPCSLAHHGYFNLDGGGDVRHHELWIDADRYLPVDQDLIPLPGMAPVAGTAFDFRQPRQIGASGYDHNFCLNNGSGQRETVARLTGRSGLRMTVTTDAPGLQFYDGRHFKAEPGLDGQTYGAHAGVALETQSWPDAPNRPDFPDAILRPGEKYRHSVSYGFNQ
nr:aldose epimerase family protein [Paracoccus amoyensis]